MARERFGLQFTIDQRMRDKLRYAEELLSHQIRPGDLAGLFDRALDALIREAERRKFAATRAPRAKRPVRSVRHIPADVKRAVWGRDGGRCTFVSEGGRRCSSRTRLEFDHVRPVARGGEARTENLRLRCRAHNQHAAEQTFGVGFMSRKRQEARERAANARLAHSKERAHEVVPYLRALGFSAQEARQRAERCETIPDASLEERVKVALASLRPGIAPGRFMPAPG